MHRLRTATPRKDVTCEMKAVHGQATSPRYPTQAPTNTLLECLLMIFHLDIPNYRYVFASPLVIALREALRAAAGLAMSPFDLRYGLRGTSLPPEYRAFRKEEVANPRTSARRPARRGLVPGSGAASPHRPRHPQAPTCWAPAAAGRAARRRQAAGSPRRAGPRSQAAAEAEAGTAARRQPAARSSSMSARAPQPPAEGA